MQQAKLLYIYLSPEDVLVTDGDRGEGDGLIVDDPGVDGHWVLQVMQHTAYHLNEEQGQASQHNQHPDDPVKTDSKKCVYALLSSSRTINTRWTFLN